MLLPALVREAGRWPWYFLAPLLAYAVVVLAVPPLRRSVTWLRVGRLDWPALGATAVLVVPTSAVLILYYALFHPDLHSLAEELPVNTPLPLVVAGAIFAVANAVMEEIIFRGILQDALASQVGVTVAVLVQAVVFGFGHMRGYPPGEVGIVLAGIYGLVLGMLREWTQGLGAAIIAHVCADATIFGIVVQAGA
jgi:membrane protease YdiL (CAAX protease family)